jgi:hypothetical protein
MAAIRNKNTKQNHAKNNSELYTKDTKTIWKTFEHTIKRGSNMSIKA